MTIRSFGGRLNFASSPSSRFFDVKKLLTLWFFGVGLRADRRPYRIWSYLSRIAPNSGLVGYVFVFNFFFFFRGFPCP